MHRITLFVEESHLRAPLFSRALLSRPYSTMSYAFLMEEPVVYRIVPWECFGRWILNSFWGNLVIASKRSIAFWKQFQGAMQQNTDLGSRANSCWKESITSMCSVGLTSFFFFVFIYSLVINSVIYLSLFFIRLMNMASVSMIPSMLILKDYQL